MAREELLSNLVWGWEWRLTHFTDFPCCREPAYSCEVKKWVILRVREHMIWKFELELSGGKKFKDKMEAKKPGHSPLTPAGKWDFYMGASPCHISGITVYHPPCSCSMQERWDPSRLQILLWRLVTGLKHCSVANSWDWKTWCFNFFFLHL